MREKRFETVYCQDGPGEFLYILLDKETGQKYLVIETPRGMAMTPMPSDAKCS